MDIGKKTIQIQNGVPHQLPWTVVGNVASSIGRVKTNSFFREGIIVNKQMVFIPAFPKCIDMRMLYKQQMMFGRTLGVWVSAVVDFLAYGTLKQFLL